LSANIRSIHGNRRELTTEERASIVIARMAGVTRKALADNFNYSPLTITRTCNHFKLYGTVESLPRSSRLLKLSPQQIKYIRILIKRNPHISWAALCNSGPLKITRNTLRTALGQAFRHKWRSIKRRQQRDNREKGWDGRKYISNYKASQSSRVCRWVEVGESVTNIAVCSSQAGPCWERPEPIIEDRITANEERIVGWNSRSQGS
jgi:hypothetical protein